MDFPTSESSWKLGSLKQATLMLGRRVRPYGTTPAFKKFYTLPWFFFCIPEENPLNYLPLFYQAGAVPTYSTEIHISPSHWVGVIQSNCFGLSQQVLYVSCKRK